MTATGLWSLAAGSQSSAVPEDSHLGKVKHRTQSGP